jgi:uncharacterized protein
MANNQPLGLRLVSPYERFWHAEEHLSGGRASVFNSVLGLRDAKYLVLESEGTDGTWAGTRMWFAAVNDTIFLRTEAESPEVRRIRRSPIVKVAACTIRGKALDDHIECRARFVPREREAQAEAALRRGYGLLRRLINVLTHSDYVYLELTPLDRRGLPRPVDGAQQSGVRALREDCIVPEKAPPDAA